MNELEFIKQLETKGITLPPNKSINLNNILRYWLNGMKK